jgi:uncharacterized membrane protein YccC
MKKKLINKIELYREEAGITYEHILGFRFAANVAIASIIVWNILVYFNDTNPIWAIASMIAAADPQINESKRFFKSRLINVLVGCAVGLFFLVVGGPRTLMLPLTLAATVLISSYIVRVKTMWRQAPITAAVVIASGITMGSTTVGVVEGLHKVGEVIFGCLVGIGVSWLMSKFWIVKVPVDRTAL